MQPDAATFERVLTHALGAGDFADAFYERRVTRTFRFQDGSVQEAGFAVAMGVGIRVVSGERAGYAFTEDLSPESLERTARVASLIARGGGSGDPAHVPRHGPHRARSVIRASGEPSPPQDAATYVDLLARADVAARAHDPRVVAVNALVVDDLQEVAIASSDGRFVADRRPLLTLGVQCVAGSGARRGSGFAGDGGRTDLGTFAVMTPESLAAEAARIAIVNAEAREAPAGEFEVVVGAGSGGVLLHEAVGHGLEGDFNRQGTSLYSGRIGERVASELVTIYDDGDLPGERGSLGCDDEGTATGRAVLVERGVLRGYMTDRQNAALLGCAATGNGRRQSYRVMPQPRMCNTYMPGGESDAAEIVASVKRGVYATSFSGGQVEISNGDFVFMLAEGYLIEDGKLGAPIRGASFVGNGPQAMERVVAVADDGRFAGRYYTCGKGGQFVPVGVGMPTIKLSQMTVGGSAVGG